MSKLDFLNKVRSLPIPPVKNILNVAVQTARQNFPEKPNKCEYAEPNGPPPIPPRPQNVHFSDEIQQTQPMRMEHHELNPFNNGINPFNQNVNGSEHGQDCTSFMGEYDQGYQRSENYLNR